MLGSAVFASAVFFLLAPASVRAQGTGVEQAQEGLGIVETSTGLGTKDLRQIIMDVVNVILGLLGIVAVLIILYGGWLWMTAAGEPEKINKAKQTLISAGIGLAIILSALGIVNFVIRSLLEATGSVRTETPFQQGTSGLNSSAGSGIIQDHYPAREQLGVPRNTKIVVTFKEPMMEGSILSVIDGKSYINDENIKIYRLCTGEGEICQDGEGIDNALSAGEAQGAVTEDKQSFIFKPLNPIGSAETQIWYIVRLTAGVNTARGLSAFGGEYYEWKFQVSTVLDLTPPQVVSVVPVPDSAQDSGDTVNDKRDQPRNVVIQINFSEAVDPTTVSGTAEVDNGQLKANTFDNITVKANEYVPGKFKISNGYRTVEFLPEALCEGVAKNSCGEEPRCLPGKSDIMTLIKADPIDENGNAVIPYQGVVDMADNSLNGDKDEFMEGPDPDDGYYDLNTEKGEGDNAGWSFWTSDLVDLVPPLIKEVTAGSGIDLYNDLSATFDKLMMSGTLTNANIGLNGYNDWLMVLKENIKLEGNDVTKVQIRHGQFSGETEYEGEITSNVRDLYQNCFQPCAGPGCPRSGSKLPYEAGSEWKGKFPSCENK